jgi:hypothetical protein
VVVKWSKGSPNDATLLFSCFRITPEEFISYSREHLRQYRLQNITRAIDCSHWNRPTAVGRKSELRQELKFPGRFVELRFRCSSLQCRRGSQPACRPFRKKTMPQYLVSGHHPDNYVSRLWVSLKFVFRPAADVPSAANRTNHSRRISSDKSIWGNVLGDD